MSRISLITGKAGAHRAPLQVLTVLSIILLSGCSAEKAEKKEKEETEHLVTVDVAPVLSSSISLKVTADAVLFPLQQAAIVAKISAPVKKFYVDRGSRVRSGQLLAELENRDLAGALAENEAAHEQADANFETISKGTIPEELRKSQLEVQSTKDAMEAQQKVYDSRQTLY